MKLLFDDHLAPLTSEYGFLETDVNLVAQWFCEWDNSIPKPNHEGSSIRPISGSLESMLLRLEPLTSVQRRRFLFIATQGPWTAYFDNGRRGADASGLSHLASELGCRAVRVVAIPNTMTSSSKSGRYGATIFELYGPQKTHFLNYVRTVGTTNDGGKWKFDQSGTPLPSEEISNYKKRNISDRFQPQDLDRLLKGLGIEAFDPQFYRGVGNLVERHGPLPPNVKEYSLAEVRASFDEA